MESITWIHLSDWHQKGNEFNRKVVRDALIKDIEKRANIHTALANVDFAVFSGDVAYSGKYEEYQTAIKEFFNPVLNAAGLKSDQLVIVPGNHDIERSFVDLYTKDLLDIFDSPDRVSELLSDERKRRFLLEPMASYSQFVKEYIGERCPKEPAYGFLKTFQIHNKKIGVIGLNSSWFSGRNMEEKRKVPVVNDYGHLILGETQAYDLLQEEDYRDADIRIAVMHHPFDWLIEFDKQTLKDQLRKNCHFILHGHEHLPEVRIEYGTGGDCTIIPAGACYDRREPESSRFANAYNYVHIDLKSNKGKVHLRRYEDRQGWIRDTATTGDSSPGLLKFNSPNYSSPLTSSTLTSELNVFIKELITAYVFTGDGTYVNLDCLKEILSNNYPQDEFDRLLKEARKKNPNKIWIDSDSKGTFIKIKHESF